jgi:hypothetical protein
MNFILIVVFLVSFAGILSAVFFVRSQERSRHMKETAQKFDTLYKDLRSSMQAFVDSGSIPCYSDREWLNEVGKIRYYGANAWRLRHNTGKISPTEHAASDVLWYKDNKFAFEYACLFTDTNPTKLKIIPALVEKTAPTQDGLQMCELKLAASNGGVPILFCTTINPRIPPLRAGDLVAFQIAALTPESKSAVFGCIGFVVAKLEPALSASLGWKVYGS